MVRRIVDIDLEVKAGVITGTGRIGENDEWYSTYLYCYREDETQYDHIPDALNIQDWAWRVVFFGGNCKNFRVLYGRRARFDSIPEFLDWYSNRPNHLDERCLLNLRRHEAGCETDCESECELHDGR